MHATRVFRSAQPRAGTVSFAKWLPMSIIESVKFVPMWEWDMSTKSASVEMRIHCQLITMSCQVQVLQTTYKRIR